MAKNKSPWDENDDFDNPWADNDVPPRNLKPIRSKKTVEVHYTCWWAVVAAVLLWLSSGIDQVQPNAAAVVLTFGDYH